MSLWQVLALALLTGLAFIASVALAVRLEYTSRAERLLAACLLTNFLILVPIHALGLLGHLTAPILAGASIILSVAVLASSCWGLARDARRDHAAMVASALADVWTLPVAALTLAMRARTLLAVVFVASAGLVLWTLWLSYLCPSDGWDSIWYHETMIGYAIQDHSYAPMDLPMNATQQANGYPRNCEMTQLWVAIFAGRTLIDAVNCFVAIPLVLAVFVVCSRFSTDRLTSIGWGCAVLTIPGAALQLRSTYIDLHAAMFLVVAMHFCTRPELRIRDAWMAAVSLTCLMGSKSMGLAWVPPLAVIVLVKLFITNRRRPLASVLTVLGSAALISSFAAITYYRNWLHFKNPLWPIRYAVKALHMQWEGPMRMEDVEIKRELSAMYREMTGVPQPGKDFADTRVFGYGISGPFILVPLGLAGALLLVVRFCRAIVAKVIGSAVRWSASDWSLLVLAGFSAATAEISPALWASRYNLHLVASFAIGSQYLSSALRSVRVGESAAILCVAVNFLSLYWATPGYAVDWQRMQVYLHQDARERSAHAPNEWSLTPEVARARDAELKAGDLTLYTDDTTFPGVLWNDAYSNRVARLANAATPDMLRKIDGLGAKWVVTGQSSLLATTLAGDAHHWEAIGLASRGFPTMAFRRRK